MYTKLDFHTRRYHGVPVSQGGCLFPSLFGASSQIRLAKLCIRSFISCLALGMGCSQIMEGAMLPGQVYHQPVIIDSQEPSSSGGADTTSGSSGTSTTADASTPSTSDANIKQNQDADQEEDISNPIVTESEKALEAESAEKEEMPVIEKVEEKASKRDEEAESPDIGEKSSSDRVEKAPVPSEEVKEAEESTENATQSREEEREDKEESENVEEEAKGDDANVAQGETSAGSPPPPPFDGEAMEVEIAGQEHDTSLEVSVGDGAPNCSVDTR